MIYEGQVAEQHRAGLCQDAHGWGFSWAVGLWNFLKMLFCIFLSLMLSGALILKQEVMFAIGQGGSGLSSQDARR